MRRIYKEINTINKFQQGVVFNNCIAEDYSAADVFGIIITPRCDIENSKVNTIHYLPIVRLSDWITYDFKLLLSAQIEKELLSKIKNILKNYSHSFAILNQFDISTLKEQSNKLITKAKDCEKFVDLLNELEQLKLNKLSNETKRKYNDTIGKTIFKELKENKKKEFYLIEDWDDTSSYCVVLLREIKRIKFEMAQKYSKGIYEFNISDDEWSKNDIVKKNNPDNFYYTIVQMDSPYIEHLIQSFFHNFGRIGVNNFEDNIEDVLINESINLI